MNITEAIDDGGTLGLVAYCVDSVIDVIMELSPRGMMGERVREYLANPTGCIIIGRKFYAEPAEYERFKRILDEAGVEAGVDQ